MDHNVLSWATARRMARPFHEHILPLVYSKISQSVLFFSICGFEWTVAWAHPIRLIGLNSFYATVQLPTRAY